MEQDGKLNFLPDSNLHLESKFSVSPFLVTTFGSSTSIKSSPALHTHLQTFYGLTSLYIPSIPNTTTFTNFVDARWHAMSCHNFLKLQLSITKIKNLWIDKF